MSRAHVFKFSEPGSRVLRAWNEQRAIARDISQRQQRGMRIGRSNWYDGVAGMVGSGFAGGSVSRLTASLAQWSGSVNADLDGSLTILRARARQLCANNEYGRRFLSLVANNVVGPCGPTLQVRALLASGKLDTAANQAIEQGFYRWSKACDIGGRMTLPLMLRVALKSAARDGEALIRKVRGRRYTHGLALQLLEADRLDERINRQLNNGNAIRQGVEIDSTGRAVAYWIKSSHPGDTGASVAAPQTERVPAEDVFHLFLPERAEQVRGYTWLHAVLLRSAMLHGYEEAAVVAARVGASKVGFFKHTADAAGGVETIADAKGANGALLMDAEPGEFIDMPVGTELQSWDPDYPHANFESFIKACMRGIASGLDVATHNLSGDMTDVNYSSARIAELSEREMWQQLQEWLIDGMMVPLYQEWLASALVRGEIVFAGSGQALPADKLSKFIDAAEFQGRRWQWVDPAKEADANVTLINNGLKSRTQIAAEQGRDFADIVADLAKEKKLLKEADVELGANKPPVPVPAPAPKPPADDGSKALMAALAKHLDREPQIQPAPVFNVDARSTVNVPPAEPAAAPVVNVDARSTVNVPPTEVTLEATLPSPVVNVAAPNVEVRNDVQPAEVNVNLPARKTVSDIERDRAGDISRVTQLETDA